MSKSHSRRKTPARQPAPPRREEPPRRAQRKRSFWPLVVFGCTLVIGALFFLIDPFRMFTSDVKAKGEQTAVSGSNEPWAGKNKWAERAYLLRPLFERNYGAGWEAANGAIGDAHLYLVTADTNLLKYHLLENDLRLLINGTWVDDRAWACLAELYWWEFTGKKVNEWVEDAKQRYLEAKAEGRFSNHEGYWTWYNWPPGANVRENIFTNSNMNQMVNVACRLYMATGEKVFLDDAKKVWYGDDKYPGIVQKLYRGKGVWKGVHGPAAFGKELPWEGSEYCSIGLPLYQITKDPKIKEIIVATAKRIMDPATGWVDGQDYYQKTMDGNGAFVHYLIDAYQVAPKELSDLPVKIAKMLEHVWTNNHGKAKVLLHRTQDHGIRNGWNPNGGEDGYGVGEVGSLHAQTQALRAFGTFAYLVDTYKLKL